MKRKRRKGKRNRKGLGEVDSSQKSVAMDALMTGGITVLSALVGGSVGAAFGKHSLLPGLVALGWGAYKKSPYWLAGASTCMFTVVKSNTGSTTQGVDGIDMKQIATDAKDRVSTFFKNFSEKLYLPVSSTVQEGAATNGLGEDVTYFINPHSNTEKPFDMDELDRLQEKVAQMSGPDEGIEFEREF